MNSWTRYTRSSNIWITDIIMQTPLKIMNSWLQLCFQWKKNILIWTSLRAVRKWCIKVFLNVILLFLRVYMQMSLMINNALICINVQILNKHLHECFLSQDTSPLNMRTQCLQVKWFWWVTSCRAGDVWSVSACKPVNTVCCRQPPPDVPLRKTPPLTTKTKTNTRTASSMTTAGTRAMTQTTPLLTQTTAARRTSKDCRRRPRPFWRRGSRRGVLSVAVRRLFLCAHVSLMRLNHLKSSRMGCSFFRLSSEPSFR